MSRFITLAIHTYEKALSLRTLLENEGITVELHNVNLEDPRLSSGVRVRIPEHDLPLALRIVENRELFADNAAFVIQVRIPDISVKNIKSTSRKNMQM